MILPVILCLGMQLPTGKTYVNSFNIPFIGKQSVKMDVLNNSHAQITLDGIIKSSGFVKFKINDESKKIEFKIEDPLLSLMKRYRCSVTDPIFDEKNDQATITLKIKPLFFSKNLCLKYIA